MDRHFAWQAWHLMTWIVTLRGRRGTYGAGLALVARLGPRGRWDAAAFCVAGVALDDMDRHFAWQAWHLSTHNLSTCHHTICVFTLLVHTHNLLTRNLSSDHFSSHHLSSHHLSSHYLSSHYLSTGHQHTGRVKLHRLVLCAQLHRVLPS